MRLFYCNSLWQHQIILTNLQAFLIGTKCLDIDYRILKNLHNLYDLMASYITLVYKMNAGVKMYCFYTIHWLNTLTSCFDMFGMIHTLLLLCKLTATSYIKLCVGTIHVHQVLTLNYWTFILYCKITQSRRVLIIYLNF